MSEELSPTEKAQRTRLVNEGLTLHQQHQEIEARLRRIQEQLFDDYVAPQLEANGGRCTLTGSKGYCEVVRATSIVIPEETLGNLRAVLGGRWGELVEVKEKLSLKSGMKRLLNKPQPHERDLAERIRPCLRFRVSHRFTFKPTA